MLDSGVKHTQMQSQHRRGFEPGEAAAPSLTSSDLGHRVTQLQDAILKEGCPWGTVH
jgi:hypothetical protein